MTNEVNEAGQKYSIVNFKLVGKVNQEVKEFCKNMSVAIDKGPRLAIAADEYNREPIKVLEQSEDEAVPFDEIIDDSGDYEVIPDENVTVNADEPEASEYEEPEVVDFDTL